MVILHNALKNSEWDFCVFLKKELKPASFQKKQKTGFKITGGLEF